MRDSRPTTFSGWFLYIAAGWGLSVPLTIISAIAGPDWLTSTLAPVIIITPIVLIAMALYATCRQATKLTKQGIQRANTQKSSGTAREDALETPEPTATQTPEPATQQAPETKKRADTRDVTAEIEKLGQLMEKGLLTQTEFQKQKRRILNR